MAAVEEFLWRECFVWLKALKLLPNTNSFELSEIHQLATVLRDGVLICNLLRYLDPELDLKDFNKKPQMAQVIKLP